jgi:hypothetical protein
VEDLKKNPICNLFYKVAFDIVGPLLHTNEKNKYILITIDHYFKWCETKVVLNHTIVIATKFLEEYIICRYGMPKFILINNGGE